MIHARATIEELNEYFSLDLPESDDYDTVAGYLLEHFRRIPQEGDRLDQRRFSITVTHVSDRAIKQVLLQYPRAPRPTRSRL